MIKKFSFFLFLASVMTFAVQSQAAAALPEIEGWTSGELRVTQLETVSGNKGTWEERNYQAPDGTRYYAVWIAGAGEKGWKPAEGKTDAARGLLESEATYKNVEVMGQKAIFEEQPLVGKSLTVKISNRGTLTLETQNAEESKLLDAASILTRQLLQ